MQRFVNVGIMSEKNIEFTLHGDYDLGGETVTGLVSVSARGFKEELVFTPLSSEAFAEVKDVTIGVNFHWQRKENQRFVGAIKIIKYDDKLILINTLDIEDYLTSVISSEMSATSSLELLKAHAVISRSWLLAQLEHKPKAITTGQIDEPHRRILWYDHDDHFLFDVCADDHCQRYQGITRASTATVVEAVTATTGQVLMSGDELVDARFSKCCGGMMELFEYCWADDHKAYLQGIRDDADEQSTPDLRIEENARKWILSAPEAFCNTTDSRVLSQVLNNYDQETVDFYRWTVSYDNSTLSSLLLRRTGIDFGQVIDMVPLERGTSARISQLKIIGTKTTVTIGKELEIRRSLSESHLYSSAFVVEKTSDGFTLHGAGWGHGVGLCQIGAAMMADKGYKYEQILQHYYPGSVIKVI